MTNILDIIIKHKLSEVAESKKNKPIENLVATAKKKSDKSRFIDCLLNTQRKNLPALIAECKKGSPSRDIIVKNYDPVEIAGIYQTHKASAVSVLTDSKFFYGKKNIFNRSKK